MSSMKFYDLMREFPEEKESLERLSEQLERLQSTGREQELTFNRIFELVEPSSQVILHSILQRLCTQGFVTQWVRVIADSGEAIKDYPSLVDVPDEVENWRTGRVMSITSDNLEVIYKIKSLAA